MATTVEDVKVKVSVVGIQSLDDLKNKTEQAKTSINGLATAILGVGFASFINGALQAADRIADFSQATNISIASLKALENAMNQSGGSGKNLEKAINTLFAAIETANNGSLQARDAFQKVGVSLDDLKNMSEADILQQTLKGLAELPPGAERAALATQLLGRSFRGIDPKQLIEALDTGRFADAEEAIKKAAEANQRLENTFKALQEGAVKAIEPIINLMGSKELNSDTAAKIITGLGIALGVAFGASALANIIGIVGAISKLNIALKGTAVVQAGLQALQGPKGWAVLAGSAAATAAAVYGLNKLLEETESTGQAAADAVKQLPAPAAPTGGGSRITSATPQAGAAGRQQELDARQKAVIESNRRIAQSTLELNKLTALKGADEIQKIEIESRAEIAKAREEIFAKENLSRAQKEAEFRAKKLELEKKAEIDIARIRQDQQNQLLQQRQSYSDQIGQLLGYEKSELQKINDQIALQPDKYREIGDELRKNAEAQDNNLRFIKEFNKEQERTKSLMSDYTNMGFSFAKTQEELVVQQKRQLGLLNATSESEKIRINENADRQLRLINYADSILDKRTREAFILDQMGDATAEQIQLILDYNNKLEAQKNLEESLSSIRIYNAEQLRELTTGFDYAYRDSFEKYKEAALDTTSQVKNSFQNATQSLEDALVRFAMTGKLSFKDFAQSVLADLARIAAKRAIVFFASKMLPGLADGGPAAANQPYIVGESGPELFVPKTSGTVIPNDALQGGPGRSMALGQTTVNYNIQAVDAASFRALVARDPSFIYSVTEQGRRSQPTRSR